MSMVERVAGALKKLVNDNWDKGEITTHEQAARAAIEAMREPTWQMCSAGNVEHSKMVDDGSADENEPDCRYIYCAMIDAALAGSDGGKQQAYVDESWSW